MDILGISEISMQNDLRKLDNLSHNVANMATPAFKKNVMTTESFSESVRLLERSAALGKLALKGAVPSINQSIDFTAGTLKHSGNPLDLAIEGNGFFQLQGPDGTYYTKRGDFALDNSGKVLLSGTQMALNGSSGELRLLTPEPTIDALGNVFENDQQVAKIKMVSFADTNQLTRLGNGVFAAGPSATLQEVEVPALRQGHLEASNTQPADEMLELIKLARHLEATQQVIRGYDDMLDTVLQDLGNF